MFSFIIASACLFVFLGGFFHLDCHDAEVELKGFAEEPVVIATIKQEQNVTECSRLWLDAVVGELLSLSLFPLIIQRQNVYFHAVSLQTTAMPPPVIPEEELLLKNPDISSLMVQHFPPTPYHQILKSFSLDYRS